MCSSAARAHRGAGLSRAEPAARRGGRARRGPRLAPRRPAPPSPCSSSTGRPLVHWALDAAPRRRARAGPARRRPGPPHRRAAPRRPASTSCRPGSGAGHRALAARRARRPRADATVAAVCVGLADQPLVGADAYRRLAAAHADGAAPRRRHLRRPRGNPVLLDRALWAEALRAPRRRRRPGARWDATPSSRSTAPAPATRATSIRSTTCTPSREGRHEARARFGSTPPIADAWPLLLDIERIAPCMPGAQLQEVDGDEYRGIVKVKVGPITAQYRGVARARRGRRGGAPGRASGRGPRHPRPGQRRGDHRRHAPPPTGAAPGPRRHRPQRDGQGRPVRPGRHGRRVGEAHGQFVTASARRARAPRRRRGAAPEPTPSPAARRRADAGRLGRGRRARRRARRPAAAPASAPSGPRGASTPRGRGGRPGPGRRGRGRQARRPARRRRGGRGRRRRLARCVALQIRHRGRPRP